MLVMVGIDPATSIPFLNFRPWMAGSGPAMTEQNYTASAPEMISISSRVIWA